MVGSPLAQQPEARSPIRASASWDGARPTHAQGRAQGARCSRTPPLNPTAATPPPPTIQPACSLGAGGVEVRREPGGSSNWLMNLVRRIGNGGQSSASAQPQVSTETEPLFVELDMVSP